MFQAEVVKKKKKSKLILCSVFFFFESRAFCKIMWKIVVEPDRPQIKIWCMRIACWMSKATHTHGRTDAHARTEYLILIAFPPQ